MLISVLMLLFAFTFSASIAQKAKIGKDFSLSIERTPCRGTCPAYKMYIDRKGNIDYEGIRGVKNIGKFHKKLTKSQLKTIVGTIEKANFFTFQEKYDKDGLADVPACTLSYTNNGKSKSIYQRFEIPEVLEKMTAEVEKLIGEEGYQK